MLDSAGNVIRDFISSVRSYEENIGTLRQKLEELYSLKQNIDAEVRLGKERLLTIAPPVERWFGQLKSLTNDFDDTWRMLNKDERISQSFEALRLEIVVAGDEGSSSGMSASGGDQGAMVATVVEKVTNEFKNLLKQEPTVAVAATRLMTEKDIAKLMKGDMVIANAIRNARELIDDELWEERVNDHQEPVPIGAVEKLLQPLGRFSSDPILMRVVPEDVQFWLKIMDCMRNNEGVKLINLVPDVNTIGPCRWWCCSVLFGYYHRRYVMSKTAFRMANMINEIIVDRPEGPLLLRMMPMKAEENPAGALLSGLESRELLVSQILGKLQGDQVDAVGLIGVGGIGKTVVAREIASRASHIFTKIIWVTVSSTYTDTVEGFQHSIADQTGLSFGDIHTVAQRAIKLYNRLREQRVLVILDDIWSKINLYEVGIPHQIITTEDCCKLLLTSRQRNICEAFDVDDANIYEVRPLSDTEARILFQRTVGNTIDTRDYGDIVDRLLKKCEGLPLTIVAVAQRLKGKDLAVWNDIVAFYLLTS